MGAAGGRAFQVCAITAASLFRPSDLGLHDALDDIELFRYTSRGDNRTATSPWKFGYLTVSTDVPYHMKCELTQCCLQ